MITQILLLWALQIVTLLIGYIVARNIGSGHTGLTVHWTIGPEENAEQQKGERMFTVTKGFRRKITASPTKQDGTPASLDGSLKGEVIDGQGVTVVEVEGDPNSVFVIADGSPGDSARIRIFADARLGPDVREISVEYDVEVIDEEASNLGLNIGEEERIPT